MTIFRSIRAPRFLLLFFAIWLLAPERSHGQTEASDELKAAIAAHRLAYLESLKKGDAAGLSDIFAQDAMVLMPGAAILKGRQQIFQDKRAALAQVKVLDGAVNTLTLEMSGDLAYEVGKFSYTIKSGEGQARIVGGKFVAVWKRQRDGTWRCQVDAGLPD